MNMIKNSSPLISIIISVYNGEEFLSHTLDSIISQGYLKREIIVIDGGSTDKTCNILKSYNDHISYWISEEDRGIYDAWNKGLKKSKGDWVCFIGADDFFWDNNVLEKISPFLEQATKSDINYVYGKVNYVSRENKELIETLGDPWIETRKKLLKKMTLAHCGSFHHKSLFEKYGSFNLNFKIAGDYEFLLREFKDKSRDAKFVDSQVIVGMRSGGVSGDINQRMRMAKETNMARHINGISGISFEIVFWIFRIKGLQLIKGLFGEKKSLYLADFYRKLKGKEKRWS